MIKNLHILVLVIFLIKVLFILMAKKKIIFRINGEKCKKYRINYRIWGLFPNHTKVTSDIKITVNEKIAETRILANNILVKFDCIKNSENLFYFNVIGTKSKYDLRIGLNREKRSIIIKSFEFI